MGALPRNTVLLGDCIDQMQRLAAARWISS